MEKEVFPQMEKKNFPKIGLALGGGGARGYAHVGVIRALVRNNIPIDFIAGSSAGALFGAIYALSKDHEFSQKICFPSGWQKFINFFDPSLKQGIFWGKKAMGTLAPQLEKSDFSQLKIPLNVVATDYNTSQPVVISEGNLADAVEASASFPLIFKPVLFNNRLLWDGSLSNPVPTDVVRNMGADIVIAVNLYNKSMFTNVDKKSDLSSITIKAIESMQYHLAADCLRSADIVIEPIIENLAFMDLDKFFECEKEYLIKPGDKATESALPEIKELILKKQQ